MTDIKIVDKNQSYDASNIDVLEGLEAVRVRPGMYIGSTSARGLHHMVWEIVDNSVDEHLAGFCSDINVTIHTDNSITVEDNGRGIPVDLHPKFGKPTVEVVLTVLHAGGKFGGGGYKVSGGLHGVGSSVVNALSDEMTARVKRNGEIYEIKFERGKTVQPLKVVGNLANTDDTGTITHFVPDGTIFKETLEYDFKTIYTRMRESAFLNPGLTIRVTDERDIDPETDKPVSETFCYHGGLVDYVKFLNQSKTPLHEDIFSATEVKDGVEVNLALQYTDAYRNDGIFSYVNNVKTAEGGTHETGFKTALTATIRQYIQVNELIKGKEFPNGEDMRVGLTAIISVKVPDPQFEGQTKNKLGNSEVAPIVNAIVSKQLDKFLTEKPNQAETIIKKIIDSFEERMAARKARQEKRARKMTGEYASLDMPDKLADVNPKTPVAEREVFLVEGDSAGGSAKQARDRMTQAILPLRGKVINTEKASIDKINENNEIDFIRSVIGTDLDEYFDYSKLRYNKVIIMTDADVDGKHIQALLLTLFYRYMRPLVERGHIYLAQPPLYGIKRGDKVLRYCYSEAEKEAALKEFPNANVQRYKGLGEMNPTQLKETTMDPQTRTLLQITVEDAAEAENLFHTLMGDESHLRKDYIQKFGRKASLDL
ncbi:DNA topoisomerase IV subunit B [Bacillus cereus]|uniref:DNA topoisomerase (ATP-hydrolyzing) n=2 Tax=Bacillus cereus group TaxID=86661 RepID=A0A9X6WN14_BACTU|nr:MULTISPECIES: DNA gyrase subunit B [Bacillus cereus group]PDZ94065.1 DNA topoisomerase IV subunit B [Bacillus cereus]PFJ39393.1 DNA topoisomerase IV subunit B [Bacillus thuringiensis]PGP12738.1 DNA topoisomerase IV subunit B [Bacillus cereus]